jgi:hypothetical protein
MRCLRCIAAAASSYSYATLLAFRHDRPFRHPKHDTAGSRLQKTSQGAQDRRFPCPISAADRERFAGRYTKIQIAQDDPLAPHQRDSSNVQFRDCPHGLNTCAVRH